MNTLEKVLREKLKLLGYTDILINSVIKNIDISLIENNLKDVEDYSKYIDVYQYDEPNVEINRVFLNINNNYINTGLIEGDIKLVATENVFRVRYAAADYSLNKRCAVYGVSNDFRIEIYIYSPNSKIQAIYEAKTYEEVFKEERNTVTLEYKEAFEKNKRLPFRKVEEILSILVSDYIFDEMIVSNINPRLKLYDDPIKYAENITTYSLRFINNKTNRIEIYEREPKIRRLGSDVIAGFCSNDPYIRVNEMPPETNFLLNKTSYYWLKENDKGNEEIAIYTALNKEQYETYGELNKNKPEIQMIIDKVIRQSKRNGRIEQDYSEYIKEVINALNIELVNPSIHIIKQGLENNSDFIIPIMYRFRFTSDTKEFEEKLYVSIEDNIGKNYKYKISEEILEELTRIGNKLAYTDKNGDLIKRQSVADFNVNSPAAIITKETFIDENRIDDLLGYIYEDIEDNGTEKLPIPSLYVDIYIPQNPDSKVSMYNGTNLEFDLKKMRDNTLFFNDSYNEGYIYGGETIPGTTYVTVRYLNSKDEVLKENRIRKFISRNYFFARNNTDIK